MLYLVQPS